MYTPKAGPTRRKNFNLSQSLLDSAREALGAATETETVERALDAVVDLAMFRRETHDALVSLAGRGGIVNYFDPPSVTGSAIPRAIAEHVDVRPRKRDT